MQNLLVRTLDFSRIENSFENLDFRFKNYDRAVFRNENGFFVFFGFSKNAGYSVSRLANQNPT